MELCVQHSGLYVCCPAEPLLPVWTLPMTSCSSLLSGCSPAFVCSRLQHRVRALEGILNVDPVIISDSTARNGGQVAEVGEPHLGMFSGKPNCLV